MQARQDLAIGVLSITAVVLFVGLVMSTSAGRNEALASGQVDRGGDYILLTSQFTDKDEAVVVVDQAAQKMNLYSFVDSTRTLQLWASYDIKAPGEAAAKRPDGPNKKKKNR